MSGLAIYNVAGQEYKMELPSFLIAHTINTMLNEAKQEGREEGVTATKTIINNALSNI